MTTDLGKDQPPLVGVVMCCTSITPEERFLLATAAEEMGAVHKFDLTSDVTHLILGSIDTPKYKYVAKERPDVKVVLPSFVAAVKESWKQGEDTDVEKLEVEHRAPTLLGLRICLTGFEQQSVRENIKDLVVAHGAEFHGDLTKEVTHLLVAAPQGNKYEHARRWGIKVVGYEWLQDAVARGMVLEETLYDPILAPQDRGKGAWNKHASSSVTLGKRNRELEQEAAAVSNRRKLRRTMSSKLESQQEGIWADIASAGSGQARVAEPKPAEFDSVLGALPLQDGSADNTPDPNNEPPRERQTPLENRRDADSIIQANGWAQDTVVYIHGFNMNKMTILKNLMEESGARVFITPKTFSEGSGDSPSGFIVVPHDVPSEKLAPIPEAAGHLRQVTEWWVECCRASKKLVDPETYPLCKPFVYHQVEGFKGLTICSTGFYTGYNGLNLRHLAMAIDLIGATYSENLVASTNILIIRAATAGKEKLDFAAENGVVAVDEQWLYECIASGVKQKFGDFQIGNDTPTVAVDYAPTKSKISGGASKKSNSTSSRKPILEFQKPSLDKRKVAKKVGATVTSKPQRGPFFEEDEAEASPVADMGPPRQNDTSRPASQPLKELSQEQQNLPRKGSQGSQPSQRASGKDTADVPEIANVENPETLTSSNGAANLVTAAVIDTSQDHLKDAIQSLLARKQDSLTKRPISDADAELKSRRQRKLLGRATSGSIGANRESSVASGASQDSVHVLRGEEHGHRGEEHRHRGEQLPLPSQKIIYEDESAVEDRKALIRKMGGSLVEEVERERAGPVGVVRDLASAREGVVGMGTRKRRAVGKR